MLHRQRSAELLEEELASRREVLAAVEAVVAERKASGGVSQPNSRAPSVQGVAAAAASGGAAAAPAPCCAIAEPQPSEHLTNMFSWAQFPEGGDARYQRLSEHPSFYRDILLPLYQRLNVPNINTRTWRGGVKSFNRFARTGLVKLIEVPGAWGAFCIQPNPGYHCDVTRAVRAHSKGKGSLEAIDAALAAADAAGPVAAADLSGGYSYIAWWVQPTLVPGLRELLAALAAEGDAARSGDATTFASAVEAAADAAAVAEETTAGAAGVAAPAVAAAGSGGFVATPLAGVAAPPIAAASAGALVAGASPASAPAVMMMRLASEHFGMGMLRAGGCVPREAGYLHTMRDLRADRDAPLMAALLEQGAAFLVEKTGQPPAHMAFHYPYQDMYSTLHVHIQTAVYPFSSGGSGRRLFHIPDILASWAAGHGDILARTPVTFWWDKGEPEMRFFYELAGDPEEGEHGRWHETKEGHHHFA